MPLLGSWSWPRHLATAAPPGLPNPFYAMDTCTKRPYPKNDITPAQQFDLLKELGYAGIAWTEEAPEQVSSAAAEAEARGLKMFAIYCGATVTAEGELKPSAQIGPIMEALRGHGTLIWLHLGGKGPKIETLSAESPVVGQLRRTRRNGRAERPEGRDLSPRRRLDRALPGGRPGGPTGRSQEFRRDLQSLPHAGRGR